MAKKNEIKDLSILKSKLKDNVLGLALVDKAEFMEQTLKELKDNINANGAITEMCQGNYSIERANPALQAYNTTIKNYTTIIKQLNDMLPVDNDKTDDGFDDF